ncbi:MAG: hypothetical protein ACOVK2_05615 [Candidatus Fonsibacter sp.]
MKKTILTLAMAFMAFSCSTEETPSTNENNTDCNCGVAVEVIYFNVINTPITKMKMKRNCTGEIKVIELPGHQGAVGDIRCNY